MLQSWSAPSPERRSAASARADARRRRCFAQAKPHKRLAAGTALAFREAAVHPFPTRGPYVHQRHRSVVARRSRAHRRRRPASRAASGGRGGGVRRTGRGTRDRPGWILHLSPAVRPPGLRGRAPADRRRRAGPTATARPSTGRGAGTGPSPSTTGTAGTTTAGSVTGMGSARSWCGSATVDTTTTMATATPSGTGTTDLSRAFRRAISPIQAAPAGGNPGIRRDFHLYVHERVHVNRLTASRRCRPDNEGPSRR